MPRPSSFFLTIPIVAIVTLVRLSGASPVAPDHDAAHAQDSAAAPAPAPVRLSGTWVFNKVLSSAVPSADLLSPPLGPPPSGGRGGGRGGFGAERRRTPSADEQVQVRAVVREIAPPALRLAIVATADAVTFTSEDGVVRKFRADGRKSKADLGGAQVDAITKWESNGLTQELLPPSMRVLRAWRVTDEGNQLVLSITIDGGRDSAPEPMTFIYDREK